MTLGIGAIPLSARCVGRPRADGDAKRKTSIAATTASRLDDIGARIGRLVVEIDRFDLGRGDPSLPVLL